MQSSYVISDDLKGNYTRQYCDIFRHCGCVFAVQVLWSAFFKEKPCWVIEVEKTCT